MYHFMATCAPEPLELSEKVQIPGHVRQYLKDFQLETLRFLHRHLANRDFCILNDESGLGKCVSTAVYLGVIAKNKTCLIVVQNDDELVASWQFHFDVLTNLTVGVLGSNTSILDSPPNIIIAKWATLRSTIDGNKYNYDYIIIDNRGQMMSNNFCMSMLLSNYKNKVNLIISSNDVTSDLKLLHNSLRLGGRLEHQYEQFKVFEAKYKLPDSKDVLNKIADLEQYFLKREMISDFCKVFRLRRYRHQYENELPLVDAERYKINLDLWRSNSSQKSNDNVNNLNANSETPTEELFNQALALDREITHIIDGQKAEALVMANNEASDDADSMSPLLIDSDSCNSDDEEIVDITNQEISLPPQNKSPAPDIYEFVDLSTEKCSEEYVSSVSRAKPNTAKKTTETRSNSRSPVQKSNNMKTIVIKDTEEIDNGKELTKSQPNRKKTKLQTSKKVLEKKTNGKPADKNDNQNEGLNTRVEEKATKVNVSNKNATVAKRQIRNKNVTKQNVGAESQTSQVKVNNKDNTITTTKRRTLKQPEKYVKQTANKIISTDKTKLATTAKQKNLDQSHKNEETLKTTDKAIERTSPSKGNDAKQHTDKPVKGKDQTLAEKTSVSKEKEVKSKQNVSESIETPRRLRQTRGDKTDVRKDKEAVTTEKVTPATVEPRNTKEKAPESDKVNENKSAKNSPKDSPKHDSVKQNVKPKSKNNTRVDVPATPTVRNTRSMQRQTRSTDAAKSKYMKSPLLLNDSRKPKKKRTRLTEDFAKAATKAQQEDESSSVEADATSKRKKNEKEKLATEDNSNASGKTAQSKGKKRQTNNKAIDTTDSAILPCSGSTEDMQCGQKIIADTHSDDGFLRPPTPVRNIRNSEPKNFLPTPISINDSEVVFVPCTDAPHKNQSIVVLSSSTDEGSLSSQHSAQSRRTRALKQKTALKRPATDIANTSTLHTTPTFGELLAKQRMQRKSPDLFSASTDLGLTCTQQTASDRHDGVETFQGFKIFGSEVKQIQQQNVQTAGGKKSKQVLSRGRSCLNILEKMFDTPAAEATDAVPTAQTQTQPKTKTTNTQKSTKKAPDTKLVKRATRGSQPVMPTLPNAVSATQQQHEKNKQTQNNDTATNQVISGALVDEEIFEITNNDAFGSVMRINSNGEISPVQTTTRGLQQPTQHNKITNYLIGTTQLTPTEATTDERTPSKRTQTPLSGTVARRSPKNKSTQSTKLTKWFQKNGTLNDLQANATQNDPNLRTQSRNTMAKRLKRRCLELSFRN